MLIIMVNISIVFTLQYSSIVNRMSIILLVNQNYLIKVSGKLIEALTKLTA